MPTRAISWLPWRRLDRRRRTAATAVGGGPIAEFRDVGKAFGYGGFTVRAIRDVTLAVSRGEFVTLVGPSGCGKSTLLNLVAGLFAPSEGSVLYRGVPVVGINESVGYMTQQDHLLPWRTALDNVALPLEIHGMRKAARIERAIGLLRLVGLAGFEGSYPSQLSGGMRKRCALARVLAYDPETLLMDEPFGALDAQLRLSLQMELFRICRSLGKTVLFVTHDLDEAIALADRCIVFGHRPGTIVQQIAVDLGSDRDLVQLRFDPRYVRLIQELWRIMAPEIARERPGEPGTEAP